MDNGEVKERDRAMLKLWEQGVAEEDIERQYPKWRSRKGSYRKRGVIDSGRGVNWAKFEKIDPPAMRGGMASSHTQSHTSRMEKSHTPAIPNSHTSAIRGMALSAEDTEALRELLTWWKARNEDGGVQSGEKQKATFWLDEGVLKAVKAKAKREGQSQAEIVAQALRAYLGG